MCECICVCVSYEQQIEGESFQGLFCLTSRNQSDVSGQYLNDKTFIRSEKAKVCKCLSYAH